MFPVNSSLHHGVSLLSVGFHRSGSPPSPILRRRYAILRRTPVAYGFVFRLPRFPPSFRALACALPVGPEAVPRGQGHFAAGIPHSGSSCADNAGLLRFPAGPSHTYAVLQDPGRIEMSSPLAATPILPPHPTQRRLRQAHDFVANARPQCLLSMLHEQRYRRPCKTGFRLAGSPLPGGSRTL